MKLKGEQLAGLVIVLVAVAIVVACVLREKQNLDGCQSPEYLDASTVIVDEGRSITEYRYRCDDGHVIASYSRPETIGAKVNR